MTGTLKFFDASRHYGIISTEAGDFFFHGTAVQGEIPPKGAECEFWLDDHPKNGGLAAVEVQRR